MEGGAATVTVSVKLLYLILAPKASWIPEAPRHFEESQWGPEKRASEERDDVCVCACVCRTRWDEMLSACGMYVLHGLKYILEASQQQPLVPSFLGRSASQCF